MAGFAVAHGGAGRDTVQKMLARLAHRGSLEGIHSGGGTTLGQRYLRADTGSTTVADLPASLPTRPELRIGYDGQIADRKGLLNPERLQDAALPEESAILRLYDRLGEGVLDHLSDAIFAFVVSDGTDLFAARDVLGIKTLFYGRHEGTLYLASEIKAILEVADDVHEFPAGHYMDGGGRLQRFADLPSTPPPRIEEDTDQIAARIREIVTERVEDALPSSIPFGCLLSGGLDSSVIAATTAHILEERHGGAARPVRTFAIGIGESEDIRNARLMAAHIGSDHTELIVSPEEALAVLSDVIYYLESFDPSLVRSSVANYLISRHAARQGIEVLLSGEGGDEIFCGYTHLKSTPARDLFAEQIACLRYLHNNACLRLDRMNLCNSIRVVAPLISSRLLNQALAIAPELKIADSGGERVEKWILRKAFQEALPGPIVWRTKQEFSEGSGSAALFPGHFEGTMEDADFVSAKERYPFLRSKEEVHYFRIFRQHFGDGTAAATVGQWPKL